MLNMLKQAMLEDKLRATDWEATNEAIEEQVARDSYLQWLRDTEKRDKALARVNNYIHANISLIQISSKQKFSTFSLTLTTYGEIIVIVKKIKFEFLNNNIHFNEP